jgi:hypothetical protein
VAAGRRDAQGAAKELVDAAPAKLKYIADSLYAKIHYKLVAADKYEAEFGSGEENLDKAIKGSKFTMMIQEEYKPRDLGNDSRVAQMITRSTMYGAKSVDKDTVKGDMVLDFIAAGAGSPIPYKFTGPFVMYRLAP